MPDVVTVQHEWVAITIAPVLVVQDPQTNELTIIGDPDEPTGVQYGCNHCDEVLDPETFGTVCPFEHN
jgi:hypothetical protein